MTFMAVRLLITSKFNTIGVHGCKASLVIRRVHDIVFALLVGQSSSSSGFTHCLYLLPSIPPA